MNLVKTKSINLKGIATVRLTDLTIRQTEIHWFEAHGIG